MDIENIIVLNTVSTNLQKGKNHINGIENLGIIIEMKIYIFTLCKIIKNNPLSYFEPKSKNNN